MESVKKRQHELSSLETRHDRLEDRLSSLTQKAFRTEEDLLEIQRIKWEKRGLKEKIVLGKSGLSREGAS